MSNPGTRGAPVGRTAELTTVRDAVVELAAGEGGSILIRGEPGIGKSTLLDSALSAALTGSGLGEVLRASCDELGRRLPLSVMIDALGVGATTLDPVRAETAALLPTAGADAAVEHLLALVDRLCAAHPVLLAVDDLHSADDASLLLWSRLSRATDQLPLLLVGACRPTPRRSALEALAEQLPKQPGGTLVDLSPLPADGVAELAGRLAGARPGPRLTELLSSASGNPLYIRETLDAASRSGDLTVADGVAELHDRVDARRGMVVASLDAAIEDRLDFLSAPCRDMLQVAALQGIEFAAADVSRLASRHDDELAPLLAESIRAGVLEPAGTRRGGSAAGGPEPSGPPDADDRPGRLRFRHGLIRQALYQAMPESLRLGMYQDAARQLIGSDAPVETVAEALLRALDVADGWELDWLAGNAVALVQRAPTVAADLFEHALTHTADDDPRAAVVTDQLAAALSLAGRYDQAEPIARRILAGSQDPERRGAAAWTLAYALMRTRRPEQGIEVTEAVTGSEWCTPRWRARLTAMRSMMLSRLLRHEDAEATATEALRAGERLNDRMATAHALHTRSLCRLENHDHAGALDEINHALAAAGSDPALADLCVLLLSNRSGVLDTLDREEEAIECLRQARTLAERVGTPRLVATVHVAASEQAFNRGDWDDALAELDALSNFEMDADKPAYYHAMSAQIAVHRDDLTAAERHVAELTRPGATDWATLRAALLATRALAAEHAGHPERGAALLSELLEPDGSLSDESRSAWFPTLARMAMAAGEPETARRAWRESEQGAATEPLPLKRAMADWCKGLARTDPAPVLAAADYFRRTHRRVALGNTLEDAAHLLGHGGDPDAAHAALTEAVAVYTELGAVWDSRRAMTQLRPLGVRLGVRGPRQRPRTGWAALTDTELRVADLVADGLSNPDIARRLMLSRRTVQTHVSHILGKLQVNSRREIAELYRDTATRSTSHG